MSRKKSKIQAASLPGEALKKAQVDLLNWNFPRARARGLKIIEPCPNELQIDLDGARALRIYGLQFTILRRAGLTKGWREKVNPSKKAGHTHVTIRLRDRASLLERIGLQAILGSDLRREAFNYCRAKRGNKYPVVFFERSK